MKKYIITGSTGYIGKMIIKKLIGENQEVTIIVRNPNRVDEYIAKNAKIIQCDLTNSEAVLRISETYDYIIHCAAVTQSNDMIIKPVEVYESIVPTTYNILNFARTCGAKSVVYLSSMEVYGQIDGSNDKRICENELGYIDLSNVRSCYPESKRMAENLCHLYHSQYGIPVKIARLAQTFGRGVRLDDTRVFSQFAQAVKENSDIVLHTTGQSMGNYCDIDDAVEGILYILAHGEDGQAYNVVNEANTMTIKAMAELVADKIAGGKIKVTYDIPDKNEYGYASKTGLRLSGEKLRKLGWEARVGLEDMYRRILDS